MKTYRYRGHSRSDPAKYRPDGELEAWKARDPLVVLGTRLAAEGLLPPRPAGGAASRDARPRSTPPPTRAESAPYPTLEETRSYVYAG